MMIVVGCGHSQTKYTEGKIVYSIINLDSSGNNVNDTLFTNETEVFFKGNKKRINFNNQDLYRYSFIIDDKTHTLISLLNRRGHKSAKILNLDSLLKTNDKLDKRHFKYTDESKIINGYKCFKAIMTMDGETSKCIIYYTKEIDIPDYFQFALGFIGFKGTIIEYYADEKIVKEKVIFKSISSEKVDDSNFVIPKDYEVK
jgi:GLPGLI family protein